MRLFMPNVSTPAGRALARAGLVLLAVLSLGGGAMGVWFLGLQPLWDGWRSRDWQPVQARVLEVQLGGGPGGGNRGAKVLVSYRYQVDDRWYEGRRYGLHQWMDDADVQKAAYVDLLYRQRVWARYNPRDPAEALLNRDLHGSVLAMALPALGLMAVGGWILWAAVLGGLSTWQAWRRRLKRAGVR